MRHPCRYGAATIFYMSQPRGKKLEFRPNQVVLSAFNTYCHTAGHKSEAAALEALAREGLQRRDLLPGPKQ